MQNWKEQNIFTRRDYWLIAPVCGCVAQLLSRFIGAPDWRFVLGSIPLAGILLVPVIVGSRYAVWIVSVSYAGAVVNIALEDSFGGGRWVPALPFLVVWGWLTAALWIRRILLRRNDSSHPRKKEEAEVWPKIGA